MQASPIKTVEALWGGELPTFETIDMANELIGALVMGLWKMAKFAWLRREELEGFVDGLFGDKESLDLPERAHKALGVLAEIRGILEASRSEDPTKPAEPGGIAVTLSRFRELTRIAEHEMHEAVPFLHPRAAADNATATGAPASSTLTAAERSRCADGTPRD